MDCRTTTSIIMKQLDGPLAEPEEQQLQAHLVICPDCRKEHAEWQEMGRLLQSLPEPFPSPGFDRRVMAAIDPALYAQSWKTKQRLEKGRMLIWMGLLGLGSLLVLETAGLAQRLVTDWLQATETYRALAMVYEQGILRSFVVSLLTQRRLLGVLPRFQLAGQWWVMLGTLNLTMLLVLIKVSLDRLRSGGRGEVQ